MSPNRRWSRAASLLVALLLACHAPFARAAAGGAPAFSGPAETLVLAVLLNGQPAEDAVPVERRGTNVAMAAADLRALGLAVSGQGQVALDSVPGLRWRIDPATQSIALDTDRVAPQRLGAVGTPGPEEALTPSGWGAIVGYDVSALKAPRASEGALLLDGSLFTPRGYGYATVVAGVRHGRPLAARRLDTGFTAIDHRRLRRLVVGDTIGGAAQFSRPVRLAGVQYGTDFSVRPDLVTFPLPGVAGAAAVPSTVDLIVNGSRRAAGEVRAGQFAVSDVPVRAGANTITVAVRDVLGRETLRTVSSYTSRALLRPGLASFVLEAGAVRLDYGSSRDRYGGLLVAATGRRGLSDRLTLEGHAEARGGLFAGGIGATFGVGAIGQVDASVAGSRADGRSGAQLAAGFERVGGRIGVAARYTRATRDYGDVAARYGAVTRARTLVLNLGFDLRRLGSASVGLLDLGHGRARQDAGDRLPFARSYRIPASRFVTASYSVRLDRGLSLLATGGADLRRGHSFYAQLGLLATLGSRTTAFTGAAARAGSVGGTAEVASNAVYPGQVGYRASVSRGAVDRIAGGVDYQAADHRIELLAERTNGRFAARGSVRGSVVITGQGVFTADRAPGSVAIVDIGGERGVRVYRDNRLAGTTDRHGRLVVTNLNPFVATKISIDPEQFSDDFAVDWHEVLVRPSERTGVAVRFDVRRDTAALVALVDAHDRPLPAGARASVGGRSLPVGMDGTVYVASAAADNRVTVLLPDGRSCIAAFPAPARRGDLPRVGPVRCIVPQVAALTTGDGIPTGMSRAAGTGAAPRGSSEPP